MVFNSSMVSSCSSVVIEHHQFGGGVGGGVRRVVSKRCTSLRGAIVVCERVLDDAPPRCVAVLLAVGVRRIHLRKVRAIGQHLGGLEHQIALDAGQQLGLLLLSHLLEVFVTEKVAVPQQQHASTTKRNR